MPDLDPQLKEFLAESAENLDRLDRDFVALEQNPQDRARLASVFRTIHTIKGTCGFFGLRALESVTHVGENLLSRLREGELLLTPESTTALLAMVDVVRGIFAEIAETGSEGAGDNSTLIATLTRLAEQPSAPAAPIPVAAGGGTPVRAVPPKPSPEEQALAYLAKVAASAAPAAEATVATSAARDVSRDASTEGAEGNVRTAVAQLDRLMNLVGELVLARNQILQHAAVRKEPTLARTTQRLNLITTELQEGVMKTRMQPISTVWSRLPRVVRDLAASCGKQVRLEMDGQDTELDRTVIEAIKDPLTHVVRNAVDHGVELPDARRAAGKPAEGRLLLRAFHEGGQVNIDITDDGRGIDPERIKAKALERGLIDPAHAARMSDRELTQLVFLPGLSTAEKVSNISGRGVGMDVVKTNVEKIGGTIDLQSRPGAGTTMRIKIPLTLAIIPALVVTSAGGRYCIPQVNLLELVRLNGGRAPAPSATRNTGRGAANRRTGRVLSAEDFTLVRELVRARSGVVLDEEKGYLADSRLRQLARDLGFGSAADVVAAVRVGRTPALAQKLVEAMTTNETSFFRDGHPFETLRTTILPDLLRRRAGERRLAIWCGACSTGQEPYSIAILLREHFPSLSTWDVRITAADLCADVLARACAGRYTQMEAGRGLSPELLAKYFDRSGSEWVLRESIRKAVEFRRANLLTDAPPAGSVDVVFLRNVLIYFDVPTKRAILDRVRDSLRPEGVLFLGGTETTWNLHDGFARVPCGRTHFYRPLTIGSAARPRG